MDDPARDRARAGGGVTIDALASLCDVTTRTIRRDLQALEEAGFPLYDDRSHDDGRTRWTINGQAFKGLSAGLTLSELCALYFSRTLLESLAGTPFRDDLESAFDKLAASLTPHMRQFLDQLPRVIASKPDPLRRRPGDDDGRQQQIIARALEATLHHRQATLTYYSRSSERTKSYLVHPYRLAYAQGGLYLLAHVPEYNEVRTFAVERIEEISLLEERFTPVEDTARRSVSALARRPLGSARARHDRVRARRRRLRARAGVAPVAGVDRCSGRPQVLSARRLHRSGAAKLDSQFRSVRAGHRARSRWRGRSPNRSSRPAPATPRATSSASRVAMAMGEARWAMRDARWGQTPWCPLCGVYLILPSQRDGGSVDPVSKITFQVPSRCFRQTVRYSPWRSTVSPFGPLPRRIDRPVV